MKPGAPRATEHSADPFVVGLPCGWRDDSGPSGAAVFVDRYLAAPVVCECLHSLNF